MVLGGSYPSPGVDTVEIIDLETPSSVCSSVSKLPKGNYGTTVALYNNRPLVCGGYNDFEGENNRCYSFRSNSWIPESSLVSPRRLAAMTASPFQSEPWSLLIVGGYSNGPLLSLEVLSNAGWKTFSPSLPGTISYHCMVLVDKTTVMLIGGIQNNEISGNTLIISDSNRKWMAGPTMTTQRFQHSCAIINTDQKSLKQSIIAVGGYYNGALKSSEILDQDSKAWRMGPNLPTEIWGMSMAGDPKGGVLLIGGATLNGLLRDIYRLKHGASQWEMLKQKLSAPLMSMSAVLIPDYLSPNCSIP